MSEVDEDPLDIFNILSPPKSDYGISCGDPRWELDEIKQKFEVTEITPDAWLAISTDKQRFHIQFGLFEFALSECDDTHKEVTLVFHGYGFQGSLREMRHIWWGPDPESPSGYLYYMDARMVYLALKELAKYFDNGLEKE